MTHNNQIHMLISSGIKNPSIAGYHGTSVESAICLAETGKLLGFDKERQPKGHVKTSVPGFLYFTPLKERFRETGYYKDLKDVEDKLFWAGQESYAETLAFRHCLVPQLGFMPKTDLTELADYRLRDIDWHKENFRSLIKEAEKHGLKEADAINFIEKAWSRRGVHIGLSDKILELELEHDPHAFGEAMRIKCKEGLSIDYIAGIAPISKIDGEALRKYLNGELKCQTR